MSNFIIAVKFTLRRTERNGRFACKLMNTFYRWSENGKRKPMSIKWVAEHNIMAVHCRRYWCTFTEVAAL